MKNLTLKKIIATLGITALALTSANVATTPANTLAATEKVVTAYADKIEEAHFSIDAANGETFVNCKKLTFTVDNDYICRVSTDNGKTWGGWLLNNTITKNTTVKVKCVKYTSNEKTLAKRFAKAKVYTYKFNVINTGVYVEMQGKVRNYGETVVDGMNVYADAATIKLGYPGKGINYGENGNVGFYKAKGKIYKGTALKTVKSVKTTAYDKKYAKLATQTLYYTLDGSTPTTKSKKVAAGKLKTIKVTNPGLNTLKVMGAKEKKVYTYTFYVDTVTVTTVDVPEANIYVSSRMGMVTPQNISVVGYKYFKTWVWLEAYDRLEQTCRSVVVAPGETMEVPHNYLEGKEIRFWNHYEALDN